MQSVNAAAERLYGYRREELIGNSIAMLLTPGAIEILKAMRRRVIAGGSILDFETQGLRKDGSLIDLSVSISPIQDEDGSVVAVSSIARDTSARKRMDANLRQAQQRFAGAFDSAPIGMALVSTEGRFLNVNPALCELLGRTAEELHGLTFQELTHPEDLAADLALVQSLLQGEKARYQLEKRYLRPDGSVIWGQLCVSLVSDGEGNPLHFVSQIQDISALKEQDSELRRVTARLQDLSLKDPLTGLGNYRAFNARLGPLLEIAAGSGGELALALFDVDDLQRLNEDHGHPAGDKALRELASVLALEFRASDRVFRIGGDEFALILPDTTHVEAEAIAARIDGALADSPAELTVSWGVAAYPNAGLSRDALVTGADAALYAAKPRLERPDSRPAPGLSPRAFQRIQRVLGLARKQLDVDVTFYGELGNEQELIRIADGDTSSFGLDSGTTIDLDDGYCDRTVGGEIDQLISDVSREPLLRALPIADEARIGAYVGVPLARPNGAVFGVLCGLSHEPKPDLATRDLELLQFLGGLVAETLDRDELEARERTAEIEFSGVSALVAALEARDHYTGEHSRGVVELALAVARRLDLSERETSELQQVAILHDIGKVAIPDSILQKPGSLSESEWELMRQHPAVGERIVASTETLAHLAPAIRAEHERYDGRGYPDGLDADRIPVISRITLACDAYHAMTSDRPYRNAMSAESARTELERHAGTQFDPRVVEALLEELAARAGARAPHAAHCS